MKNVYLVMVDAAHNNNKFYRMTIINDAQFEVTYGRVGAKGMKHKFSLNLFDQKYREKIQSGYIDVSSLHTEAYEVEKLVMNDKDCEEFLNFIIEQSNHIIKKNYSVSSDVVTKDMVEKVETLLLFLSERKSVEANNRVLLEIFATLPRCMSNVDDYLIHNASEINEVIMREYQLLDVLKAKVNTSAATGENGEEFLKKNHLSMRPVTDKETEQIKKHLGAESRDLFHRAFRVYNEKTDERFYQFMNSNGYSKKDIHYLYHGSRNENIWGLASMGASLAPKNVVITGKMFGNGIYFANRAKKSIGYSSLHGSYWTGGTSSRGYLLVYKVLYKNQKDVVDATPNANARNIAPHDAVFAHKGVALFNDEIIIYNESQATLQYVIELR